MFFKANFYFTIKFVYQHRFDAFQYPHLHLGILVESELAEKLLEVLAGEVNLLSELIDDEDCSVFQVSRLVDLFAEGIFEEWVLVNIVPVDSLLLVNLQTLNDKVL